jgi:hypothetical protein
MAPVLVTATIWAVRHDVSVSSGGDGFRQEEGQDTLCEDGAVAFIESHHVDAQSSDYVSAKSSWPRRATQPPHSTR